MPEPDSIEWEAINWRRAVRMVEKYQRRIVRAFREGNIEKLTALQYLATRSYYAKAVAVLTVANATGARSPGVDRIRWTTDSQKYRAILAMRQKNYQPSPYLRIFIKKPHGNGVRPLSVPTMADRAMQMLYKFTLEPLAEYYADHHSYGYRQWRSAHDAMFECRRLLLNGAQWIIEADIKGCFDNISHKWLLANIPMERDILYKILKTGCKVRGGRFLRAGYAGVSQGGPLSPLLCNLTLDGLRGAVLRHDRNIEVIRFADDFVILSREMKPLCDALASVAEFMRERGLALSREKTYFASAGQGFDFLGFHFKRTDQAVLITPSESSIKQIVATLEKRIRVQAKDSREALAARLNAVIRGWRNYHQYSTDSSAFSRVDTELIRLLAKYNIHPSICALLTYASEEIEPQPIAAPLQAANPFDADWHIYFEEWEYARRFYSPKGRRRLEAAYERQHGLCTVCLKELPDDFSIHKDDSASNGLIELLHPDCHARIHGMDKIKNFFDSGA
jgi:RNA-directed DNA polymerase